MFERKKHLCSNCKKGKASFDLDNHSEMCLYISCYNDDTCEFYEPLETEKKTLWEKISGVFNRKK